MKDKYVIYFKTDISDIFPWIKEPENDSINVDSYKNLKLECMNIINDPKTELLSICSITPDGEYIEKNIPKSWYK